MQKLKWLNINSAIAALAILAIIIFFVFLGIWQLDRAAMKKTQYESYQQKISMLPVRLNDRTAADTSIHDLLWRRVNVQGEFSNSRVYVLENQMQNGQPGYHVLSPFLIYGSDQSVLVNRGWVASGPYRDQLPEIETPTDSMSLQGVVYLPQDNAFLSDETVEVFDNNVVRIQKVNLNTLGDRTPGQFLPFLINLDSSSPAGYVHVWHEPGYGKERHIGYAVQWFALALVLAIICFTRLIKWFKTSASS